MLEVVLHGCGPGLVGGAWRFVTSCKWSGLEGTTRMKQGILLAILRELDKGELRCVGPRTIGAAVRCSYPSPPPAS